MKFTLAKGHYSWSFNPVAADPGAPASALAYSDSGNATCHGAAHHHDA